MNKQEVLNNIKKVVRSFLPDAKIFLFGSRSKGISNKDSDYDLLLVTKKKLTQRAKLNWKAKIHLALVDALELPFDILLNSESEIKFKQTLSGHIVRNALKDAIEL